MASASTTIAFCSQPCGCGDVKPSCEDHGYVSNCSGSGAVPKLVCLEDTTGTGNCEKSTCYDECPCKYSEWSPAASEICSCLTTVQQTRTLLEGRPADCTEPLTQNVQGTRTPQWGEWSFDKLTSEYCDGVQFRQTKTRRTTNCNSSGGGPDGLQCYEEVEQDATGTKQPDWSPIGEWSPSTSTVCEGEVMQQNADHTDLNKCKPNERRSKVAYGTKVCNNGEQGCWKATSMSYSVSGDPKCTTSFSGGASNVCRFGTPRDVADQESGSATVSCPPGDYCEGRVFCGGFPDCFDYQGVSGGGQGQNTASAKYAFEDCQLLDYDGFLTVSLSRCPDGSCG